jgi:hypothetical protein
MHCLNISLTTYAHKSASPYINHHMHIPLTFKLDPTMHYKQIILYDHPSNAIYDLLHLSGKPKLLVDTYIDISIQ